MEERTDWEDAILALCVWSWLKLWVRCLGAGKQQDMQHMRQKDNIPGCIWPSCIVVMDISLIFFLETFSCLRACRPRVFFSVREEFGILCSLSVWVALLSLSAMALVKQMTSASLIHYLSFLFFFFCTPPRCSLVFFPPPSYLFLRVFLSTPDVSP